MKPKPKQALEQIVTISEQQRLFGTYTIRLAVFHCKENQQDRLDGIREMANLLNAKFILLHDPYDSGVLSQKDHERLRHGIVQCLRAERRCLSVADEFNEQFKQPLGKM